MTTGDDSASDPLTGLLERARVKAADWRGRGVGDDLDLPVHPPAQSALLATYLTSYLGSPLEPRDVPRSLKGRLAERLLGHERAKTDRLFDYARLLTQDLAKTICNLEVELAELRARVGLLEDGASVQGSEPIRS